ncbi:MAG: RNA polymerase factor sigma-54 [Phycisphaerales bacterium]|jgi:RNA polymerase sigma-54 factor|nr:RNA polymerase factor sigma-54 [Phycisphaerales bacterium]
MMRFEASQHMKLGQQMKLAPRMIQSMEILQMSLAELQERIEQELENNPTLELVEPGDGSAEGEASDAPGAADPEIATDAQSGEASDDARLESSALSVGDGDDFARLESYEASNPDAMENEYSASGMERFESYEPMTRTPAGERDGKLDAIMQAPARSASLHEQLLGQWALCDVAEDLRPLGVMVISFLDDDGYLRTPLETIAERAPEASRPSVEKLEQSLTAVQLFLEPPGVAARDARECLLLQLDALEEDEGWDDAGDRDATIRIARTLVAEHLDDLMQNRIPRISDRTGLSLDEIKRGIELMRRLSLAPARRLVDDSPESIVPDAIVEYDEDADRYVAYLNDSRIPGLRINREYAMLARDRAMEKRDREFIKTNLGNAAWLIDAVNQRKHTLLRVVRAVVDAQRDFFDYGPQALRPLPMTQVAEQLGVHVATVSRAVADKHLLTPRGIVPLRRFFSGGLSTEGGEDMSYDAVRAALQEVIDAEDKKSPMSDDQLVEALRGRGIEIARRTVAKYRSQMGVPTARLRKQF